MMSIRRFGSDVLGRINDHNIQKLDHLLPWNFIRCAAVQLAELRP
jgi:hypothetical protein